MKKIRDNLLTLKALIERTPEEGFNLNHITVECGTLHCTLGWAAKSGLFASQGLTMGEDGEVLLHGVRVGFDRRELAAIFGAVPWALFNYARGSIFDTGLRYSASHKEMALNRIEMQLLAYPE